MKVTRSSYFIPQLLGYSRFIGNFMNCYIGDVMNDNDHLLERVYLRFSEPNDAITLNMHYIDSVELPDKSIMYAFNVPEKYKEDFNLYKDGKYSQISRVTKDVIIGGYGKKLDENNLPYGVLTKQASRKEYLEDRLGVILEDDMELMSILDLEVEVFSE